MKKLFTIFTGLFIALSFVFSLNAKDDQEVIDKLSSFKASGADYSWDRVPQDTKYASNVKKNIISKLQLPANFKVELFAIAPDARNMAFETWLKETLSNPDLSETERWEHLQNWERAPNARYCHTRE